MLLPFLIDQHRNAPHKDIPLLSSPLEENYLFCFSLLLSPLLLYYNIWSVPLLSHPCPTLFGTLLGTFGTGLGTNGTHFGTGGTNIFC